MAVEWDQAGIDELLQLGGEAVDMIAGQIIDAAQPPVDTGFLQASGYVYSARLNTFDQTWDTGYYESTKGRGTQYRERAPTPEQPGDEYGATVGWAAAYAYEIEDISPFMYQALLDIAGWGQADAITSEVETKRIINMLLSG